MTAHLTREYATSSHPLIDEYLTRRRIRQERDRGATGELARHRRTRGGKSATVSDSASGGRDDDRDGSS